MLPDPSPSPSSSISTLQNENTFLRHHLNICENDLFRLEERLLRTEQDFDLDTLTLKTQNDKLNRRLNGCEAYVQKLEDEIGDLKVKHEGQVSGLKERIGQLTGEVIGMRKEVVVAEKEMAMLESKVEKLENETVGLKEKVELFEGVKERKLIEALAEATEAFVAMTGMAGGLLTMR